MLPTNSSRNRIRVGASSLVSTPFKEEAPGILSMRSRMPMRQYKATFPAILETVKSYATVGEIWDAMREIWGTYWESALL
jgi:methylmalonyl-CoA mutase N-terminal domain/subunit